MNIKFIVITIFIFFIFIFPSKAKAEILKVYYLKDDNVCAEMLQKSFEIQPNKNLSQKIFITLDKLFNNVQNINYIPKNTKVLNVERIGNKAYINLNACALSYGGGSSFEIGITSQILYNIFQFPEIEYVTIYINNQIKSFPEGSLIYDYPKSNFKRPKLFSKLCNIIPVRFSQ